VGRDLLRITRISEPDAITLKLEGKLAGPWVEELQKTWRSVKETAGDQAFVVDLNDVTYIDEPGERLLRQMHTVGTVLVAEGPYMSQRLLRITRKKRRSQS
jgi:anti-anti-sigma regulatory factor